MLDLLGGLALAMPDRLGGRALAMPDLLGGLEKPPAEL